MKKNHSRICFWSLFLLFLTTSYAFGQGGYSSASMGLSREASGLGIIPPPDAIRVEEYLNYHKHALPMPESDEPVRMDIRWGAPYVNTYHNEAVLQIGFTTLPKGEGKNIIPPLNVGVVVDKSGSMNEFRKIQKVKEALLAFLDGLREDDIFSIAVFDHESEVIFPSQKVGNKVTARLAIEGIAGNGSTNINSGLMDGLKQVEKKYDKRYTNAVILLTDGIANQGETAPEKILNNAMPYIERGITVSTIGVGRDLNHNLLRDLAQQGKGQVHFLADSADVKKIFVQELEALLSPKARKVRLEVEGNEAMSIKDIYGYSPKFDENRVQFELDNMNAGLTQVVLLRYQLNSAQTNETDLKFRITLTYEDVTQENKKGSQMQEIQLKIKPDLDKKHNWLADAEVKKNYCIAQMAQGIKQMATLHFQGKTEEAEDLIDITVGSVKSAYKGFRDPDVSRMLTIIEQYAAAFDTWRMSRKD